MFSSSFMHHGVDTASPLLRSTKRLHQHLKNEEEVVVANVDADQHRELAERYGVSGYPTLKFFPKNNKDGEDYEGGRDLDDFVNSFNEKCDTSHDAKGQLTSNAGIIGIIATLDTLVKELVHIEKSLLEMEIMKHQKRNQLAKMMQLMKNLFK